MSFLMYGAIKVSAIVGLALVAITLMRHQSAAVRHWVLAAAILCAAAMPAVERVVPSWQLGLRFPAEMTIVQPGDARDTQAALRPLEPPRAIQRAPSSADAGVPADFALGWMWLAGVVVNLMLLLVGFIRLTWLASRARPVVDGSWPALARDISREQGLSRSIRLLESEHPALLVTWGIRQPKVLLPATARHWNTERIRVVLRHELAHIRRRDWEVQIAAEIVRAIYWFNPLVWIASRRLRDESEQAADDAVLSRGVEPSEYATHLVDVARTLTHQRRSWAAAPAMARSSSLERRITAMLNTTVNRQPLSSSARALTTIAMLVVTVMVAGGVLAQSGTARFSGSVSDPSGAFLPETTITLTHGKTSAGHAVPTDESGYFELANLPPGEYTLEARALGFKTLRDTVTLAAGDAIRRDIRMNIGSVEETITVRAGTEPGTVRAKEPPKVKAFVERLRGQRLQPPIKIKDVRPRYPQALADEGIEGTVVLDGNIAADGSVTIVGVITPAHEELVNAAREAATQWRFEPTRLWGTPVDVNMTMTFNFKRQQ